MNEKTNVNEAYINYLKYCSVGIKNPSTNIISLWKLRVLIENIVLIK